MELAEGIVYCSIWAALCCYPAGPLARALVDGKNRNRARMVWSAGCVAFWIHVLSAFGVFYDWSHTVGLRETARQTLERTGVESNSGLYLNYLFALLWTVDAAWSWWRPDRYRVRPLRVFLPLHGFFLFLIVNGAFVFVDGPRRWFGLALTILGCGAVAWAVWRAR